MPKIGKEWMFEIVHGAMALGRVSYARFGVDLYALDRDRHIIVPISTKMDPYDPRHHLIIDRHDPAFTKTGLDRNTDPYLLDNEARPESVAGLKHRGMLTGALAEKFVLWSGRSGDRRVLRGRNPAPTPWRQHLIAEFLPWRDDPGAYKALTRRSDRMPDGQAAYDPSSRKIVVSQRIWPTWYWWVFSRAQQAWDIDLKKSERKQWIDACREHRQQATDLLHFWMAMRQEPIDVSDANRQAQIVFTEACVVIFGQNSSGDLARPMAKLATELGADIFWRDRR